MERTHRVDLYAPSEPASDDSVDDYGHATDAQFSGAAIATAVECNLQPLTGSVRQAAAGREIDATWRGFFPPSTPLVEDMGIVVTAVATRAGWVTPPAAQPKTFRVRQVGYEGEDWDIEALLGTTREQIPAEAS